MNLLKAIPFLIACLLASPANSSELKALYEAPKMVAMQLILKEAKAGKVTFRFGVKSLLGESRNIKMTAKVIGDSSITPTPNAVAFRKLDKGQVATLEFSLPITKEKAMDKSIKIQGTVEYLPDYNEQIKAVRANADTDYPNYSLREKLINQLIYNLGKNLKSVEIIRFMPGQK